MKNICSQLAVLSIVLFFSSCTKENTLRGSGNIISEIRDVGSFVKVHNSSSINIIIREGSVQNVELSADDNIIGSIKTTVESGVLKIDLAEKNYIDVTITISLVMPNLEALKNTGSGNSIISGFEGLANLVIENEGSGSVSITGSGTSLNLKNLGSGSYLGFDFAVENCTVSNSGSGNCEINCSNNLSGSISGSGSIFYKGTPTVDVVDTGSGEIRDSN